MTGIAAGTSGGGFEEEGDAGDVESPETAPVPFWVLACARLSPPRRASGQAMDTAADKVITAVQVLLAARVRVHGRAEVRPNLALLARMTGYTRADRAAWIIDYLQQISFLEIVDGGQRRDGHRMARHDPATGRKTPNLYLVRERPPTHYTGPRTLAGLARALTDTTRLPQAELFTSPQLSTYPTHMEYVEPTYPTNAEETTKPPVAPYTALERYGPTSHPEHAGYITKPQVDAYPARAGALDRGSSEGSTSINRRNSTAPKRATPGAPVGPEHGDAWQVIVGLPWPAGSRPTHREANELAAMVDAATTTGLTYAEIGVHLHARFALVRTGGNAVAYMRGALHPDRLPVPQPHDAVHSGEQLTDPAGSTAPTGDRAVRLAACDLCGAADGAPKNERLLPTAEGRNVWCRCVRPDTTSPASVIHTAGEAAAGIPTAQRESR